MLSLSRTFSSRILSRHAFFHLTYLSTRFCPNTLFYCGFSRYARLFSMFSHPPRLTPFVFQVANFSYFFIAYFFSPETIIVANLLANPSVDFSICSFLLRGFSLFLSRTFHRFVIRFIYLFLLRLEFSLCSSFIRRILPSPLFSSDAIFVEISSSYVSSLVSPFACRFVRCCRHLRGIRGEVQEQERRRKKRKKGGENGANEI